MKNEFARLLVRPPTLKRLKIEAALRGIPLVELSEEIIGAYFEEKERCDKTNAQAG
jgi:hypothetical protein